MRLIFFALVTGVLSGQALAADLSVPPPPRAPVAFVPPPPVFTWSGIYIGGNGGYSFGTTTPSIGELSGPGFSTNGTVAGGTIGGNYQAGVFVFGVEGDFDWDNIKGNPSACVGCQVSSTWLATARGRVGVAWDRLLFYGTVGAAFQNVKFAVTAPPLTTPLAHDRRCSWRDRWRGRRIRHITELVGEGRIPVRQLQQPNDWPGDLHPDRECCARWCELSVLALLCSA